jgi:uncharacterized protein
VRHRLAPALIALAAVGIGIGADAAAQTPPAKKELVQRLMRLQQPEIESFARGVVERPAAQMMREAGLAIQAQVPVDKREATGHAIEAEVKKYVDEAYPIVRERALRLAPSAIGPVIEAKMSEDELRQLLAWLESPTAKKYQQIGLEMRNTFTQKLLAEMPGVLDPKLVALDGRIRAILGVPPASEPAPRPPAAPRPGPGSK